MRRPSLTDRTAVLINLDAPTVPMPLAQTADGLYLFAKGGREKLSATADGTPHPETVTLTLSAAHLTDKEVRHVTGHERENLSRSRYEEHPVTVENAATALARTAAIRAVEAHHARVPLPQPMAPTPDHAVRWHIVYAPHGSGAPALETIAGVLSPDFEQARPILDEVFRKLLPGQRRVTFLFERAGLQVFPRTLWPLVAADDYQTNLELQDGIDVAMRWDLTVTDGQLPFINRHRDKFQLLEQAFREAMTPFHVAVAQYLRQKEREGYDIIVAFETHHPDVIRDVARFQWFGGQAEAALTRGDVDGYVRTMQESVRALEASVRLRDRQLFTVQLPALRREHPDRTTISLRGHGHFESGIGVEPALPGDHLRSGTVEEHGLAPILELIWRQTRGEQLKPEAVRRLILRAAVYDALADLNPLRSIPQLRWDELVMPVIEAIPDEALPNLLQQWSEQHVMLPFERAERLLQQLEQFKDAIAPIDRLRVFVGLAGRLELPASFAETTPAQVIHTAHINLTSHTFVGAANSLATSFLLSDDPAVEALGQAVTAATGAIRRAAAHGTDAELRTALLALREALHTLTPHIATIARERAVDAAQDRQARAHGARFRHEFEAAAPIARVLETLTDGEVQNKLGEMEARSLLVNTTLDMWLQLLDTPHTPATVAAAMAPIPDTLAQTERFLAGIYHAHKQLRWNADMDPSLQSVVLPVPQSTLQHVILGMLFYSIYRIEWAHSDTHALHFEVRNDPTQPLVRLSLSIQPFNAQVSPSGRKLTNAIEALLRPFGGAVHLRDVTQGDHLRSEIVVTIPRVAPATATAPTTPTALAQSAAVLPSGLFQPISASYFSASPDALKGAVHIMIRNLQEMRNAGLGLDTRVDERELEAAHQEFVRAARAGVPDATLVALRRLQATWQSVRTYAAGLAQWRAAGLEAEAANRGREITARQPRITAESLLPSLTREAIALQISELDQRFERLDALATAWQALLQHPDDVAPITTVLESLRAAMAATDFTRDRITVLPVRVDGDADVAVFRRSTIVHIAMGMLLDLMWRIYPPPHGELSLHVRRAGNAIELVAEGRSSELIPQTRDAAVSRAVQNLVTELGGVVREELHGNTVQVIAILPLPTVANAVAPALVDRWAWMTSGEEQARKLMAFNAEEDARLRDTIRPLVLLIDLAELRRDPLLALQLEAMRQHRYFAKQGGAIHLVIADAAAQRMDDVAMHTDAVFVALEDEFRDAAGQSAVHLRWEDIVSAGIAGEMPSAAHGAAILRDTPQIPPAHQTIRLPALAQRVATDAAVQVTSSTVPILRATIQRSITAAPDAILEVSVPPLITVAAEQDQALQAFQQRVLAKSN